MLCPGRSNDGYPDELPDGEAGKPSPPVEVQNVQYAQSVLSSERA